MPWWNNIFKSKDNVKTIVDGGMSLIDNAFYTKQEKAENKGKMLGWYLEYLKTTNPQNKARRTIAFLVVGLWVLLILVGVTAKGFEQTGFATYIFDTLNENVNQPFLLIVGFYFAVHLIRGWKK